MSLRQDTDFTFKIIMLGQLSYRGVNMVLVYHPANVIG